jgi:hypothetical protein
MPQRPLLPLPDYQRIYQVIFSVLEASEIALTHRACIFFASVGAVILREKYGLEATISAGCMALMIDKERADVVVYGRDESGTFVNDENAFHAWVECDGWLIDFMAPIMGKALAEDGHPRSVPRRMLQKPLAKRKGSLAEIQHLGDFYIAHDRTLAEAIIDGQSVQFGDLLQACLAWYRRPPKPLKSIALADSHGPTKTLTVTAPSIEGIW